MKSQFREYRSALVMLGVSLVILLVQPASGKEVFRLTFKNTLFMLGVVPPIFLMVGLFDVWVPKEKVVKRLGEHSGFLGMFLCLALGIFAAGPLYAAFPVAEVLLRKGTSLRNVWIFLGAWSTMKIPMFLFEAQSLGYRFALSRYAMSFLGVFLIAFLLEWLVSQREKGCILEGYLSSALRTD
ncbi:permease [Thermatribacter velox]|uniref:Permease n=1 Tax=Thermatribacter velox TaxID=3039681 RepID=A0ABZ2Y9E1_9BACT